MVFRPDTTDAIYTQLKSRLTNRIDILTNFSPTSFNYLWLRDAFAGYIREFEVAALAIQFSGWVDYAGKELTQEDLAALGIDDVDPSEVNQYMYDYHLDELAKEVGVSRDPGQRAEGEVTITTTSDTVTIKSGTEFGTQPDADGNYLSFYTTEDVSPSSGSTTVTAPVIAGDVGTKYNVGSSTITYMPDPLNGVSDVTNAQATSNGVDRESNPSLRNSVKNAIFEQSGGGTRKGLQGYVDSNVEGVNSVSVEEFTSATPPYVDVIVEGGTDSDAKDAIEHARPLGIKHNLVRPTTHEVNTKVVVSGGTIDVSSVENALASHITGLPLGGDIIRDKLVQTIMNADNDISMIDSLHIEVASEAHTYEDVDGDGTVEQVYALDKGGMMKSDGIVEVTGVLNGSSHTFVEGTDFEEADSDADGANDAIDWSLAGDNPDTGTNFSVTYRVQKDLTIAPREKADPHTIKVTE